MPPLNRPTLKIPARLAASISQTASPTAKQFRAEMPRLSLHEMNKSGSGFAALTSLEHTMMVSSGILNIPISPLNASRSLEVAIP
jgi:hypothetical protein